MSLVRAFRLCRSRLGTIVRAFRLTVGVHDSPATVCSTPENTHLLLSGRKSHAHKPIRRQSSHFTCTQKLTSAREVIPWSDILPNQVRRQSHTDEASGLIRPQQDPINVPAMTCPPATHSSTLRTALTISTTLALLSVAVLPARESFFRSISGIASSSPTLGAATGVVASLGLLILVAVAVSIAAWSWVQNRTVFWQLAVAGGGVLVAYALSESIKLLVTEQRPCHTLDVATVLTCPEPGDWSWPSNHSVLAAAFATACILAIPRSVWIVVPAASAIAISRVAAGVHYAHDVTSGLALGVAVVTLTATAARPLIRRLPPTLLASPPAHR